MRKPKLKMLSPLLTMEHYKRLYKVLYGQGWSNDMVTDGEILRVLRHFLQRQGVDMEPLERR